MTTKNENTRCSSRTKRGEPCRAAATAGGLCFFHANPNKASELGRIGGRSKGHAAANSSDLLPTMDNAVAVRDTLVRLISDVYAGKLQPKVAAALVPLINQQLRAIEMIETSQTANLKLQVEKLEKQLAEGEGDQGPVRVVLFGSRESDEATKPYGSNNSLDSNKTQLKTA